MTHSNQRQEVGFWLRAHLLRLSCFLTMHLVASYDAYDIYTTIILLKFKHLIHFIKVNIFICNGKI